MANGYTSADKLARTWVMDIFIQDMANGYYLSKQILAKKWLMALP
jgi:hypothetical protein